ncbi:hypothetical protein MIND_00625300 [Mycena indigotica]|uniref:Uncharacterized protein n=1 Tax=Mycena indigotica TaxID=2126181 RepID=A0A8H6W5W0_9AGAR|nr:uncharacterized protein MIND_00625300 [Mycena indigotica]KAF7303946.1 hypothetical protein MIND_00625300 [Mycena indigotica]
MNCQFTFGPNRSYFCSADSYYVWSQGSIPTSLQRILQDHRHPQAMATPYDVAFPMEPDAYSLCWRTTRGELCSEASQLASQYSRITRFLRTSTTTYNVPTTRTVFGPNASFFSMSQRGYSWQNLPHPLEEDLQTSLRIRRPTSIALGAHGAYVALYNDGTVNFDLRGLYPLVDAIIRDTQEATRRKGILYLSLNPHVPGEFYLVFGDASAKWNIPSAWTSDVTSVSREIKPIEMSSPPASLFNVSTGGTAPRLSSPTTVNEPRPISPVSSVISAPSNHTENSTSSSGYATQATPQITTTVETEAPPAYALMASRPSSPSISSSQSHSLPTLHQQFVRNPTNSGDRPYSYTPASPSQWPSLASASSSSPMSVHSAPEAWPGDVKGSTTPAKFRVTNPGESSFMTNGAVSSSSGQQYSSLGFGGMSGVGDKG